jgi:flagellar FliL protein
MAEHTTSEPENEAIPAQPVPRSSSAILMRVAVLLFLAAVIGAECLVASLCLPAGSEPASAATPTPNHEPKSGHSQKDAKDSKDKKAKKEKQTGHAKEPAPSQQEEADSAEDLEVDLEQFSVTARHPTSNTTMRIEFHLYGVVNNADKAEFERLLKVNQHRLRDQVLVIVRSAEGRDLADAGLGLIKRQILEKTNALLGKPILRAVIVSDFSYMEQ